MLDEMHLDPRLKAYMRLVRDRGIKPEFIYVQQGRANVRRRISEYIKDNGCMDALFCHNDDYALGAYRGLCDLGIKVPDDVALTGCDGIEDTEYLEVPISTIVQPLNEIFTLAWQMLQDRINDPSLPIRSKTFTPHFAVRQSSDPTAK